MSIVFYALSNSKQQVQPGIHAGSLLFHPGKALSSVWKEERDILKKGGSVLCQGAQVKYAFVRAHSREFRIKTRSLSVSWRDEMTDSPEAARGRQF